MDGVQSQRQDGGPGPKRQSPLVIGGDWSRHQCIIASPMVTWLGDVLLIGIVQAAVANSAGSALNEEETI